MAGDGRGAAVSVPREEWEWYGVASHLIVGRDCRFHLATVIGPWLVSTVGEYLPGESVRDILATSRGYALEGRGDEREASWLKQNDWEEIGYGRKYETMVFRVGEERCTDADCDCGQPKVTEWSEVDSDVYNLRGDATRGHYAMCEKWAELGSLEEALA